MSTETQIPAPKMDLNPLWDARTEAWLESCIAKNVWRVHPELDEDDLRQEALVVWLKLNTSEYRAKMEARSRECKAGGKLLAKHMFAMFQRSVVNRFSDITVKYNRRREQLLSAEGEGDEDAGLSALDVAAPERTEDIVMLRALVGEVPEPFRSLLRAYLDGELPAARDADGVRETRRQRLARQAGVSVDRLDGMQAEIERWARRKFIG